MMIQDKRNKQTFMPARERFFWWAIILFGVNSLFCNITKKIVPFSSIKTENCRLKDISVYCLG